MMIDYQCESCGHRFEEFYHSDAPVSRPCPAMLDDGVCGATAPRRDSFPGEYRPTNAQRFDPILVFQSLDGNDFSFAGRNNEACPPGYKPVVLDSIQAADQFTRRFNAIEGEKGRTERALNHMYFDQRTKERRDDIRRRINGNAKAEALFRAVCESQDKKRDAKRAQQLRWEPNGNFQVFSRDASNRQPWNDRETDWKSKRV